MSVSLASRWTPRTTLSPGSPVSSRPFSAAWPPWPRSSRSRWRSGFSSCRSACAPCAGRPSRPGWPRSCRRCGSGTPSSPSGCSARCPRCTSGRAPACSPASRRCCSSGRSCRSCTCCSGRRTVGGKREHAALPRPARRAAGHALAQRRRPGEPAGRGLPRRVRAAGRPVLAVRPAGPADDGPGRPGPARSGGRGQPGLLVRVLPYLTVVIAAFAPLAAGIYLLTSLAWSLAERRFFWRSLAEGLGPLSAPDHGPGEPEVPPSGRSRPGSGP